MDVYWDIEGVSRKDQNVLTVGTFDGVHRGHQFILASLRERAVRTKAQTTLVTFDTHPQIVLQKESRPTLKILTTAEEKLALLGDQRIDNVVVVRFTEAFSKTGSREFVTEVLHRKIGCSEIVIGDDHAFGKDREGDVRTLRELGAKLGFSVTELPAFLFEDTRISSTKIRRALNEGRLDDANRMLGRCYSLNGRVVKGDGRGKSLMFPTANLSLPSDDKLVPADGVYAVQVHLGTERYEGMMNIGFRPTFEESRHQIEVHLFEFDREIYGEQIGIQFVTRIRNEIRFRDADSLVRQLKQDKQKCMEILNNPEDIHAFNK